MSDVEALVLARRRADLVARMRRLGAPDPDAPAERAPAEERCELCNARVPDDHRHLLHLQERRIVCACEACWAMRSGDPEYRPTGMRTRWLADFDCDDELWAAFQIPIGLAFFMRSALTEAVVALYPSSAGATECELDLEAWDRLMAANPVLAELDVDAEALLVNRTGAEHQYAIAPIDECYRLVGLVKTRWEGISGGAALEQAVPQFFADLREKATLA